jgi:hypothetical protein
MNETGMESRTLIAARQEFSKPNKPTCTTVHCIEICLQNGNLYGFVYFSQQKLQVNAFPFSQIYTLLLQVYQHSDVFIDTVSVTKKCGLLKPRVKKHPNWNSQPIHLTSYGQHKTHGKSRSRFLGCYVHYLHYT